MNQLRDATEGICYNQQHPLPPELKVLDETIAAINRHPDLEKAIVTAENDVRWLQMTNIINGHVDADSEMVKLLTTLSSELDSLFISSTGHHSKWFYQISVYGYRMRTGERDSFGPLSSIMMPPHCNWQVCYG